MHGWLEERETSPHHPSLVSFWGGGGAVLLILSTRVVDLVVSSHARLFSIELIMNATTAVVVLLSGASLALCALCLLRLRRIGSRRRVLTAAAWVCVLFALCAPLLSARLTSAWGWWACVCWLAVVLVCVASLAGRRRRRVRGKPQQRRRVVPASAVPELRPSSEVRVLQAKLSAAEELAELAGFGVVLADVLAEVESATRRAAALR